VRVRGNRFNTQGGGGPERRESWSSYHEAVKMRDNNENAGKGEDSETSSGTGLNDSKREAGTGEILHVGEERGSASLRNSNEECKGETGDRS